MIFRILVYLTFIRATLAYGIFRNFIPNGKNVQHPCHEGQVWHGVGHFNNEGSGFRNPFGMDFKKYGKKWTPALCRIDSDGDGRSNGEELGDPHCVWTPGEVPFLTTQLSHPGICEPITSERCKHANVDFGDLCRAQSFDCPPITKAGVKKISLRLPKTTIPTTVGNHMCYTFNLTDYGVDPRKDYHIIAFKEYIDNSDVVHHMNTNLCGKHNGNVKPSRVVEFCSDVKFCHPPLITWNNGVPPRCIHENVGFRMGKRMRELLTVYVHWSNPTRNPHLQDASGIDIYYTEKLRAHDATNMLLGSNKFTVPALQDEYEVTGTCTSWCSRRRLRGNVHIFYAYFHTHKMGVKAQLLLTRNGVERKLKEVNMRRGASIGVSFKKPILFRRGDELKAVCIYSSKKDKQTIAGGLNSYNEMCVVMIYVYPKKNVYRRSCRCKLDQKYLHRAMPIK